MLKVGCKLKCLCAESSKKFYLLKKGFCATFYLIIPYTFSFIFFLYAFFFNRKFNHPFLLFWLRLHPCSASSLQQLLHNTHLHSWANIYSGKVARSRVHSDIPTGFWAYNVRKTFFSYGLCAPDIWCGYMSACAGVYPADWRDSGLGLESQATKKPYLDAPQSITNIFMHIIHHWDTLSEFYDKGFSVGTTGTTCR